MESNNGTPEFAAVVKTKPVVIGGKPYTVRELTGKGRDAHLDRLKDRAILNTQGQVIGYKTYDGCQSELLSQCLFDENDELVSMETLQGWPASTIDGLHDLARDLSKLSVTEEVKEASKNE